MREKKCGSSKAVFCGCRHYVLLGGNTSGAPRFARAFTLQAGKIQRQVGAEHRAATERAMQTIAHHAVTATAFGVVQPLVGLLQQAGCLLLGSGWQPATPTLMETTLATVEPGWGMASRSILRRSVSISSQAPSAGVAGSSTTNSSPP